MSFLLVEFDFDQILFIEVKNRNGGKKERGEVTLLLLYTSNRPSVSNNIAIDFLISFFLSKSSFILWLSIQTNYFLIAIWVLKNKNAISFCFLMSSQYFFFFAALNNLHPSFNNRFPIGKIVVDFLSHSIKPNNTNLKNKFIGFSINLNFTQIWICSKLVCGYLFSFVWHKAKNMKYCEDWTPYTVAIVWLTSLLTSTSWQNTLRFCYKRHLMRTEITIFVNGLGRIAC